MATLTNMSWNASNGSRRLTTDAAQGFDPPHQSRTHESMAAVRDTLIVLALQLVFRATMIMRRWNY